MKKLLRERRCALILVALFLAFALLYALLPYADDDWDWGTQGGLDRLQSGFADYNGRYAGNLLILVLTRVPLLKVLVPALCLTLLCALPAALCGARSGALLLGACLTLSLSRFIAQETLLWLSGFANYAMGTLFLLLALRMPDLPRTPSWPVMALCALCLFAGCLFMEHITVCLVLLTLTACIARSVQKRRVCGFSLLLLAACALGAACMFSNGAYANIFARQDFYRTVARPHSPMDFLTDDCYKAYYYTLYPNLLRDHPVTILALALSCTALYSRRQSALRPYVRALCGALCAFLCLFAAYLCAHTLVPDWEPLLSYTYPAELCVSLLVPVSLFVLIALLAPAHARPRMTLELLCILFLCAPLFVIAPVSARNFLPTYVLTVCLCVEFAHAALADQLDRVCLPLGCVCAICASLWLSIVGRNCFADRARVANARAASASGAQSVILPRLPYENFSWNGTPGENNPMTQGYFRLFYGLRDELVLEIVDYQTYYEMGKPHA